MCDRIGVRQSQRAVGKDDGHFAQKVLHLCPLTDGVENRADQDEAVHLLLRHSLQGAQRLRPVAAGVAEDDLVPSAAKLALDASAGASRPQPYSVLRIMATPISKAAELDSPEPRSTSLAV